MAVITETVDDLVREAETLKTRLEEERAKFNDMERTSALRIRLRSCSFLRLVR